MDDLSDEEKPAAMLETVSLTAALALFVASACVTAPLSLPLVILGGMACLPSLGGIAVGFCREERPDAREALTTAPPGWDFPFVPVGCRRIQPDIFKGEHDSVTARIVAQLEQGIRPWASRSTRPDASKRRQAMGVSAGKGRSSDGQLAGFL